MIGSGRDAHVLAVGRSGQNALQKNCRIWLSFDFPLFRRQPTINQHQPGDRRHTILLDSVTPDLAK